MKNGNLQTLPKRDFSIFRSDVPDPARSQLFFCRKMACLIARRKRNVWTTFRDWLPGEFLKRKASFPMKINSEKVLFKTSGISSTWSYSLIVLVAFRQINHIATAKIHDLGHTSSLAESSSIFGQFKLAFVLGSSIISVRCIGLLVWPLAKSAESVDEEKKEEESGIYVCVHRNH